MLEETSDQSLDAGFVVGVAAVCSSISFVILKTLLVESEPTNNHIRLRRSFGQDLRAVVVAFDNMDIGVQRFEVVRLVTEKHRQVVLGMMLNNNMKY